MRAAGCLGFGALAFMELYRVNHLLAADRRGLRISDRGHRDALHPRAASATAGGGQPIPMWWDGGDGGTTLVSH